MREGQVNYEVMITYIRRQLTIIDHDFINHDHNLAINKQKVYVSFKYN